MSLTNDVKRELCGCDVPDELRDTLRCGMMFGFRGNEPYFLTRDKTAAGFVKRIFPKNSMETEISKTRGGTNYCIMPKDPFLALKYGFFEDDISREMTGESDVQVGIFLRGVFITSGNVCVQKAGYHLEIAARDKRKCESLYRIINEQGMNINISHRGDSYFLYSKNSENISDTLTFMGAVQSAMEIMNIKIIKEVRSNINRSVNCETANMDRTARASAKQLEDIRYVLDVIGEDKLPDDLREIVRLRSENPDMSLRDLGTLVQPNSSRSGVNHRFERLSKFVSEHKERSSD